MAQLSDAEADSIIPPGKKFPDGNKEYNFWSDAIDWLANHHLFGVNKETLTRYEKQANEVGNLGRLKWEHIFRGTDTKVNNYSDALRFIAQAFQRIPQGIEIPIYLLEQLRGVLRFRKNFRGTMDNEHRHVLKLWQDIGRAVVNVVTAENIKDEIAALCQ